MEGSKRERSPGVWELRVYVGSERDVRTGRQRKRWKSRTYRGGVTGANRALRQLIAEVEQEREAGGGAEDPTLREHLEGWLAERPTDATARSLADHHILPTLGLFHLSELKVRHVDQWASGLAARGLAPASVHRAHNVLRSALEQAVRWELIPRNPAAGAKLPRVIAPEHTVPTPELLALALEQAADDIHTLTLIRLAAATGARRGQLVGLQWGDIDHDTRLITFRRAVAKVKGGCQVKDTKTGAIIRVPVGDGTLAQVQRYRRHRLEQALACGIGGLAESSFVFAQDPAGERPWYPDTASSRWRALARDVVIDGQQPLLGVRLHDLRHAQGTGLIAAGVDVKTVASRLGHSSPTVTLGVYAHPVTEAERRAADIAEGWLDQPS